MAEELKNVKTTSTRLDRFGVSFPYLIAPMVGVSHVAFRELVRAYSPTTQQPLIFTEMLSSRRLPNERLEEAESLKVAAFEEGLIPQLLGNEERFIAPSIEKLKGLRPWGLDINMGCPTKKTLKHNWGVRLLGDRKYAAEVVSVTRKHWSRPLSVKLRAGLGTHIDFTYLADFTKSLEDAGADWLTVHCRPSEQRHRGKADWDVVAQLAKIRSIPVVGNGDVQTADDACALIRNYEVDGAMIGRAALARPWILWQIAYQLGDSGLARGCGLPRPPLTPDEEGAEYFRSIIRFIRLCQEFYGESEETLKKVRLYTGLNHMWLPFGHHFWVKLKHLKSLESMAAFVQAYSEEYPQPLRGRISH